MNRSTPLILNPKIPYRNGITFSDQSIIWNFSSMNRIIHNLNQLEPEFGPASKHNRISAKSQNGNLSGIASSFLDGTVSKNFPAQSFRNSSTFKARTPTATVRSSGITENLCLALDFTDCEARIPWIFAFRSACSVQPEIVSADHCSCCTTETTDYINWLNSRCKSFHRDSEGRASLTPIFSHGLSLLISSLSQNWKSVIVTAIISKRQATQGLAASLDGFDFIMIVRDFYPMSNHQLQARLLFQQREFKEAVNDNCEFMVIPFERIFTLAGIQLMVFTDTLRKFSTVIISTSDTPLKNIIKAENEDNHHNKNSVTSQISTPVLIGNGLMTGRILDPEQPVDRDIHSITLVARQSRKPLDWIRLRRAHLSGSRLYPWELLKAFKAYFKSEKTLQPAHQTLDICSGGETRMCVNCGSCHCHCPMDLFPSIIIKAVENMKTKDRGSVLTPEELGIQHCCNCGICTYVCTSKIEIGRIMQCYKKEKSAYPD
ncbi:MAG: hypothetical protein CVV64_00010 [Candidatus Wallbacteria bacterium HGW-Wallbacteria-1]|jgi:hypothetical protein|uniref:4Fe-4S ferredoxin-type domain-containing protein n=1 Tax=Candidatus Wallbacteria bacterium HGW-Wallbacteria-1 TaxID=2013854 RepID=A0A2N1PU43_9BACT|nr:MAG: hypothetical protein CVV64_00010 [Candidatus Wallbacteria bacterium HGW-Wallbacteria-1]